MPVVASYSAGEKLGALTGYLLSGPNRERTKCLLIEDIFWNNLTAPDRQALLETLLDRAHPLAHELP